MKTAEYISHLFEIRINAHIAHLQTKSFSQHKALEIVYEGIVELTDSLVEVLQNKEIITGYPQIELKEGINFVDYLKNKIAITRTFRTSITETEIQQKLDDITEFLEQGVYRLKFLS